MRKPKSFEDGMETLEQLLEQLADPATPLEKAVKLYSDSAVLLEYCTTTLQNAKLEMEQIDVKLNTFTQTKSISGAVEEQDLTAKNAEEDILA